MRLLENRVLVKLEEAATMSAGGIALPPSAQKDHVAAKAKVLDVGPGLYLQNGEQIVCEVAAGDDVLLANYSGVDVDILKYGKCKVIRESDILLIL